MRKLFPDTGYIIALEAGDDQHHSEALAHWQAMSESLPPLVTTSYVFNEIVTFFNSRKRHVKAVETGKLLFESPSIKLVHVDEVLFRLAWRHFVQHSDKSYSLTDCASFLVMKQLDIRSPYFRYAFHTGRLLTEAQGSHINLNSLIKAASFFIIDSIQIATSIWVKWQEIVPTASVLSFSIDAWVLLPDPIHCIWTLPSGDALLSGLKTTSLIRVTRLVVISGDILLGSIGRSIQHGCASLKTV